MGKKKKTGRKRNKLPVGIKSEKAPKIMTKGMASSKSKAKMLAPSQPLPHDCNLAGRCCWGGAIGVIHYDVWRMVTGGRLAMFGFNTTTKLTSKKDGVLTYGLGPVTRLPVCFIKLAPYQGKDGAAGHCPFLQWDDSQVSDADRAKLLGGELPGLGFWKIKGKPRFICGLGPFKPVQCQIFPMGRIGESGTTDDIGKWRFFCDTNYCRKCMVTPVRKVGCNITTAQHLQQPHIKVILEYTRDYIDLLTMLVRRNLDDEVRQFVAEMMFDFDTSLLKTGGVTTETLEQHRPPSPGELMKGIAVLVAGVMAKQDQLRKEQDQLKTEKVDAEGDQVEQPAEEESLIVKP